MKLTVHITARHDSSTSTASVNGRKVTIDRSRDAGRAGEGVTAGELLCMAVGAAYADELMQEAARRSVHVERVHVTVEAETGGRRTTDLVVGVRLEADADEPAIMELIEHADRVSETAKMLRLGAPLRLADVQLVARG